MNFAFWLGIFGVLALLVTIPVHFHLAAMRKLQPSRPTPSPLAGRPTRPCPRCGHPSLADAPFCEECGVPMMLWKLKSARVSAGDSGGRLMPIIQQDLCIGCSSCVNACDQSVLQIVAGKSTVARPEACTGPGACIEVCPTGACQPSSGDGASRKVEIPRIDHNFETNEPGIYAIGELGGLGLIKNAVNEGHLVVERILRSHRPKEGLIDVIIVGAGPAGLSAALAAKQAGLRSMIFEQGEFANTIRRFPNRKIVMSEPVRIPMYGSLWISDAPKEALLSVWQTIIDTAGVVINENEAVTTVHRTGTGAFRLDTIKGSYECAKVILAIGKRGVPNELPARGNDLGKVLYHLTDAAQYNHCRALVVGGGDSAAEAAVGLSKQKGNVVSLSYRRSVFSRLRERNQTALEACARNGAVTLLLGTEVEEVREAEVVLRDGDGRLQVLPNDFVFAFLGGRSSKDFLEKTGVEMVVKEIMMEGAQTAYA